MIKHASKVSQCVYVSSDTRMDLHEENVCGCGLNQPAFKETKQTMANKVWAIFIIISLLKYRFLKTHQSYIIHSFVKIMFRGRNWNRTVLC